MEGAFDEAATDDSKDQVAGARDCPGDVDLDGASDDESGSAQQVAEDGDVEPAGDQLEQRVEGSDEVAVEFDLWMTSPTLPTSWAKKKVKTPWEPSRIPYSRASSGRPQPPISPNRSTTTQTNANPAPW